MNANNFVTVTIILFMYKFENGVAIKCFVCDSNDNPGCADLSSNSSIVPEECTLDKMKSIDTWLFELNRFAYFDTGSNRNPLMNCQKVVARDPNSYKMVTARFCQLNTGDSDACAILQAKLRSTDQYSTSTRRNNIFNNNNNNNYNYNMMNNQNNNQLLNGRQIYGDQYKHKAGNNNGKDNDNEQDNDNDMDQHFHCSICLTDGCNGATSLYRSNDLSLYIGGITSFFSFIHLLQEKAFFLSISFTKI